MPKHPVPKKKQSKTRSKKRYHTYENKAQKRLTNVATAYRHRLNKAEKIEEEVVAKKTEKIAKIKV